MGVGYEVRFERERVPPWRTAVLFGYLAVALAYLGWRATIINWGIWYGPLLYVAEVYGVLMTSTLVWLVRRIDLPIHRPTRLNTTVDALIPTCNEPLEVLAPTIQAALGIRGIRHVLVLDDGARPEVAHLARQLGAKYFPRHTNLHAKAGNMNNGLAHTDAQFVVCLDADHVAQPQLLERTLGYFDDPDVALVQSPQLYYNRQSFLFRRRRHGGWWSEQAMFYDVVQPAKNRYNAAFFVGTSAVLRRSALDTVDGFATGTATEDIHTSLRLHAHGWKSVFIKDQLAFGLEAESLKEYYRQRRRWAAGSLGLLLRSPDSPLRVRGLTRAQRLSYLTSTLSHLLGVQRLVHFVLPVIWVMVGTSPIHFSSPLGALVPLAFYAGSSAVTWLFGRGAFHPIFTSAYNLSHCLAHAGGLWGIANVSKKFGVSRKRVAGSERTSLKAVLWALAALVAVGAVRATELLAARPSTADRTTFAAVSLLVIILNGWALWVFLSELLAYERRAAQTARPRLTLERLLSLVAPRSGARAGADEPALDKELGELDRVGGGALAQVVRNHPQVEGALVGRVVADAPDEDLVAPIGLQRRGIPVGGRFVQHGQPGRAAQQLAALRGAQLLARLDIHRLGMAVADRDAHAGDAHADRLVAQDLARLEHHLALFIGVVVAFREVAGASQHVERDGVRVDLRRRRVHGMEHRMRLGL
jgi:cellulose synthase/poly-beta-1,6-N-acetylglucosamine synthase-like glycosyltransferase